MSIVDDAFDEHQGKIRDLLTELKHEVQLFDTALERASELSDLQSLNYQTLLDKTSEIEVAVDDVPENVDTEEEEEDDEK